MSCCPPQRALTPKLLSLPLVDQALSELSICREKQLKIRQWGLQEYTQLDAVMKAYTTTLERKDDEIWTAQYSPVYTLGSRQNSSTIQQPNNDIPQVQTDRGGLTTYHGPGQLIVYPLINLKKRRLLVKAFVQILQQSIIRCLQYWEIPAESQPGMVGVYVHGAKIASIGIRIRQGCSSHGLALNIQMDKQPFEDISPCGYDNLIMTQMSEWVDNPNWHQVTEKLINELANALPNIYDHEPPKIAEKGSI